MKLPLKSETRRARPLLGTIIDLCYQGPPDKLEAAFGAIEKVHRLMSFYDSASDVSRINGAALRRNVTVNPWTWRVLKAAQRFARESDGVFDVTAAQRSNGNWHDIVLEENCAVRFRRRVIVDLGGIAKGFECRR
jgi:FAD:protein FMN transferase